MEALPLFGFACVGAGRNFIPTGPGAPPEGTYCLYELVRV